MRKFFYRLTKNLVGIYACLLVVLSYRLVYNEFYLEINDEIEVSVADGEKIYYPSGKIVGIYTDCNGVFVIDTCAIESSKGESISPAEGAVKTGDYILQINGETLSNKEDMISAVQNSNGAPLELTVSRNEEVFSTTVTPVRAKNGEFMVGIWVKDDLAGVGTITYFTSEGEFAALGHGMSDGETQNLLQIEGGDVYVSNIIGIEKGKKGDPGEIKGVIYYGKINHIGELSKNTGKGIFGKLDMDELNLYVSEKKAYEIADIHEITVGPAQIISEVSGDSVLYDIEITYVDYLAMDSNKGLHVKVTDSELIELTGGIIQGMSGSPIIQNGKLIGAITHVLINDPEQGYGIFINQMME